VPHRGGRVRISSVLIMQRSGRDRRLGSVRSAGPVRSPARLRSPARAVAGPVRSPTRCGRRRCQWPSHHRSVVGRGSPVRCRSRSPRSIPPSCREQHSSWRCRAIQCRSMTRCAAHLARRAVPSLPVPKTIKDLRKGNYFRGDGLSDRQASAGSDQGRLALGPVTGRAALSRRPCSSASGPCRR